MKYEARWRKEKKKLNNESHQAMNKAEIIKAQWRTIDHASKYKDNS